MSLHPNHQHPLTKVSDTHSLYPGGNGNWECDNCKQTFDERHHPWHCSICSYDLCEVNCLMPKHHIRHQLNHGLYYTDMVQLYTQYCGVWKCDGCCEVKQPEVEQFAYHCFVDQFDLCKQCFDGHDVPIHLHKLKPADTLILYDDAPSYWICDICKRSGAELGTFYFKHDELEDYPIYGFVIRDKIAFLMKNIE